MLSCPDNFKICTLFGSYVFQPSVQDPQCSAVLECITDVAVGVSVMRLASHSMTAVLTTSRRAFNVRLKGIVHPKMKIKSIITRPHAVPTL